MKQTHCEMILDFFKQNGGKATLGELLEAGRFSFAHKLTGRLSDLRKKGHIIVCEKGKNPSNNLYTLMSFSDEAFKFKGSFGEFNFL